MSMNRHQINAMMSDTSLQTLTPQESARLLFDAVKRKARDRGLPVTIDRDYIEFLCGGPNCPATGLEFDMRRGLWLPFRQSLDRIDNTRGYEEGNVQVVANIYNQAKAAWPEEYVDRMCQGRTAVLEAGGR
jgi:hypothetical protein